MMREGQSLNGTDGVVMTSARYRGHGVLVAIVACLIAVPGLVAVSSAAPGVADAPPALDRFLAGVGAATPPAARILVAGSPPAVVFYRAVYLLYPRTVFTAFPTDFEHGWSAPPVRWDELLYRARRDGATYVLTWAVPLRAHGLVRLQHGAGALVQVAP
jgi:hypothetical protein